MTAIENIELDIELQELYIISKHWISDLNFFDQDLDFFKKLLTRSVRLKEQEGDEGFAASMKAIVKSEELSLAARTEVTAYMHMLEGLISKVREDYQLSIIETHAALETKMAALLQSFKSAKNAISHLQKTRE